LGKKPGGAYEGMAGERELVRRREDAQPPLACVFDEHRLREAEVRCDPLPGAFGDLAAPEEHAQGIPAGTPFAEEDLQDV
jgi:hypothetical protein